MNDIDRSDQRDRAMREAVDLIERFLADAARPGWFGRLRLALDVQDGVVTMVRDRGATRTHPIGRGRTAA